MSSPPTPPKTISFPPPPVALLRVKNAKSDQNPAVINKKKNLRNSLERSASTSGILTQAAKQHKLEKDKQESERNKATRGSEPLLDNVFLVNTPETFEKYIENSYGGSDEAEEKSIVKVCFIVLVRVVELIFSLES